jgi:hypothetical protein
MWIFADTDAGFDLSHVITAAGGAGVVGVIWVVAKYGVPAVKDFLAGERQSRGEEQRKAETSAIDFFRKFAEDMDGASTRQLARIAKLETLLQTSQDREIAARIEAAMLKAAVPITKPVTEATEASKGTV